MSNYEPKPVRDARAAIEDWDKYGVCPEVRKVRLTCAWTCWTCKRGRAATVGSVGDGDYGRSRVRGPNAPNGVRCALIDAGAALTADCCHVWEGDEYGLECCALCGAEGSRTPKLTLVPGA